MRYELFYWPGIQGRGEYVRLALEDAGAEYLDVGRGSPDQDQGVPALEMYLSGDATPRPPFSPPAVCMAFRMSSRRCSISSSGSIQTVSIPGCGPITCSAAATNSLAN